jgi:hypothetical protein
MPLDARFSNHTLAIFGKDVQFQKLYATWPSHLAVRSSSCVQKLPGESIFGLRVLLANELNFPSYSAQLHIGPTVP